MKGTNNWPFNYREVFWTEYPRRVAKMAAIKVLERICKSGKVEWEKLIGAVRIYAKAVRGKDMQYIAHPATWLNQGRWDDDPASLAGKIVNNGNVYAQMEIERTAYLIAKAKHERPTEEQFDAQFERLGLSKLRVKRRPTVQ